MRARSNLRRFIGFPPFLFFMLLWFLFNVAEDWCRAANRWAERESDASATWMNRRRRK